MYIDKDGTKKYRNSNREDGPAIEYANGIKCWYKEGEYHRTDGPAIEYPDKSKSWYLLNKKLKEKEFNSWILRIQRFI